jgi:hypothetical protein
MPEDIVDRLERSRQEKLDAHARDQELALQRFKAVEENSDFIWQEIFDRVKFLVEKYNRKFSAQVSMAERTGCPPNGIDVYRQTFPIAKLSLWRASKHLIQFSTERTEQWITKTQSSKGRIDLRADDDRNVYIFVNGQRKTPTEVADELLGPVLA